ncbi:MAG: gamma carbonic anhydrase family protein [Alphaproteobacteria bacterium]|nr:gamma carbonic anhydrase family protein [Alphaproteobacteria bacterium]
MQPIILPFRGLAPRIAASAFIAPGAVIIGDVEIGERANIWFGCVLRGDIAGIVVGADTNIQDGTVVHVSTGKPATHIGANVTIGHMALIHACRLEDGSFVGMKACVADGAVIESGAMVAAGALVTPGKRVPTGELWGGSPARLMRRLSEEERRHNRELPGRYVELAKDYPALPR